MLWAIKKTINMDRKILTGFFIYNKLKITKEVKKGMEIH